MAENKFTTDDTGNQLDLLERVADMERRAKQFARTTSKRPTPHHPKPKIGR